MKNFKKLLPQRRGDAEKKTYVFASPKAKQIIKLCGSASAVKSFLFLIHIKKGEACSPFVLIKLIQTPVLTGNPSITRDN